MYRCYLGTAQAAALSARCKSAAAAVGLGAHALGTVGSVLTMPLLPPFVETTRVALGII